MKLDIFVQVDLCFRSCWTTSRSTRCAPSPPWRRPAAFAPGRRGCIGCNRPSATPSPTWRRSCASPCSTVRSTSRS
ncbi:LysR substrate-binding domain protein [Bordetella bronchiseptica 99-R-0433]|nr:LysR substrate-binding domain protein [Bordetella bronchiseptica 99-R-0433]